MSCSQRSVGRPSVTGFWPHATGERRLKYIYAWWYISFIRVEITLLYGPVRSPSRLHISGLSDFYSSRKVMLVIQCVQFAGNISRRLIYALSRISGNVQLIVLLIYCFARANQDKWSSRRRCAAEKYIIKLKHLLGSHKTRVKHMTHLGQRILRCNSMTN